MVEVSRVRQDGVLAPWAHGFADALLGLSYKPHGAVKQLQRLVTW